MEKSEASEDVHFMFFEACRCGGCKEDTAKLLYVAVLRFGPSWTHKIESREFVGPTGQPMMQAMRVPVILAKGSQPDEQFARKLQAYIKKHNPSLEELQNLDLGKLD